MCSGEAEEEVEGFGSYGDGSSDGNRDKVSELRHFLLRGYSRGLVNILCAKGIFGAAQFA